MLNYVVDGCQRLPCRKECLNIVQIDPLEILPTILGADANVREQGDFPVVSEFRIDAWFVVVHVKTRPDNLLALQCLWNLRACIHKSHVEEIDHVVNTTFCPVFVPINPIRARKSGI